VYWDIAVVFLAGMLAAVLVEWAVSAASSCLAHRRHRKRYDTILRPGGVARPGPKPPGPTFRRRQ
jgi:hypothetical protein